MFRRLDRHQVCIVDTAVAAALDEAPARILTIAEAKVIEADALEHARVVEDLATALAEHAAPPAEGEEPLGMDHWRAEAFAMLADPAAVASPRWSSRSRSDRIETSVPTTGTPPRRPLRVLDRVS
ncbi:hypothetical protein [Pimelobacter simplex]|uniref:hypothetical protein n=1 Tax=Nocardioides simplex TaxID=2045 RepID=UPI0019315098|nr:hypothetical protein [Pimelobacter simplex]